MLDKTQLTHQTTQLNSSVIPVRRMDFKFAPLKHYWYDNNPWITHLINGLSCTFPDGERFFMHSVRYYQDRITDPILKNQINAFIGQEANHGKEHEAFNQMIATTHKVPLMRTMRIVKNALERIKENTPPRFQLALTVSAEHFTAIMAHQILRNADMLNEMAGEYADLFLWHAVEEVEHKSVAFDVYQAVDGNYFVRIAAMSTASVAFVYASLRIMYALLKRERKLGDWRSAIGLVNFLVNKPGLFVRILPEYIDFFRTDFNPRMHKDHMLIVERVKALKSYEINAAKTAA